MKRCLRKWVVGAAFIAIMFPMTDGFAWGGGHGGGHRSGTHSTHIKSSHSSGGSRSSLHLPRASTSKQYRRSSTSAPKSTSYSSSSTHHTSRYANAAPRDSHGKIKRSETAKRDFERSSGYPHGRPGYVVDHIIPLARGGSDSPSNMQWQTKADAKAKDKWELGNKPKQHTKAQKRP